MTLFPDDRRPYYILKDVVTAIRTQPINIIIPIALIALLEVVRRLYVLGMAALIEKIDGDIRVSAVALAVFSICGYIIYAGISLGLLAQGVLDNLLRISRTFSQQGIYAMKRVSRVASSIILAAVLIASPLLLSAIVFSLYFSSRNNETSFLYVGLLSLGGATSVGWAFFASLRFVLIPFVALFEPQISLGSLSTRSMQLLALETRRSIQKAWAFALGVGFVTLLVVANIDFVFANRVIVFVSYALVVMSICYFTALYHNLRLVAQYSPTQAQQ